MYLFVLCVNLYILGIAILLLSYWEGFALFCFYICKLLSNLLQYSIISCAHAFVWLLLLVDSVYCREPPIIFTRFLFFFSSSFCLVLPGPV